MFIAWVLSTAVVLQMKAVDFLRLCRPFRVGEMLRMGPIKARLAEESTGLSFTEFAYQTMQAYDWRQLWKKYNCQFQVSILFV